MSGRGYNHSWNYERLCSRPVRSILIIKPRAIGDVLLSTIVCKNLRSAFPDARIDFFTEHTSRDVIEGNPHINNAIVFRLKQESSISLFRSLYKAKYDLVFDLFCNPFTAQMTFASRATVRVGYPFRGRKYAYNVYVQSRSDDVHNTEFNLDPLTALGIPIIDRTVSFPVHEEALKTADGILSPVRSDSKPIIALNSSGTWETKRWGLQHFAELADLLVERHNAIPVLLWGPGEEGDVEAISNMMKNEPLIPPRTSLKELAALLSLCDYTISNDSGPMHISAAVGTPTLGIFGPTNPLLQGPYNKKSRWVRLEGLECLACNLTTCNIGNICMIELPVQSVLEEFESMMNSVESR
jgi:lipopolysaccharide heptosyltransferase II